MIKVAILDLYDGVANQGMRCIRDILHQFGYENDIEIQVTEFDVRRTAKVPNLQFDAYISTGGPGSPLTTADQQWEKNYFQWFESVQDWNDNPANLQKKHTFLICHSFQLVCRHLKVGHVNRRNSTSFGIFPIHVMPNAADEPVFENLRNPFFAVDSRDFQVTEPNHARLRELGAKILCLEKDRPHVPMERAIMAIRFSPYLIGTQFHPEADAVGMSVYFQQEDKKATVIANHGEDKWINMIDQLNDPEKILFTYHTLIPNFLRNAVGNLIAEEVE